MYIFATSSNINKNDYLENQHCVFMRLYWAIFLGATFASRSQIMTPRVVWDRMSTADQVLRSLLRLFLLHRIWWWRWFLWGLPSCSDARNHWASLGWRTPVFPGGIWKDSSGISSTCVWRKCCFTLLVVVVKYCHVPKKLLSGGFTSRYLCHQVTMMVLYTWIPSNISGLLKASCLVGKFHCWVTIGGMGTARNIDGYLQPCLSHFVTFYYYPLAFIVAPPSGMLAHMSPTMTEQNMVYYCQCPVKCVICAHSRTLEEKSLAVPGTERSVSYLFHGMQKVEGSSEIWRFKPILCNNYVILFMTLWNHWKTFLIVCFGIKCGLTPVSAEAHFLLQISAASVYGWGLLCCTLPSHSLEERMQRTAGPRQGHFGPQCNSSLSFEQYAAPH